MAKPAALRTSLIWHDEVMGDVVGERPQSITIGPFEGATFITPDLGLPLGFAIVRPGTRGNVLALGARMRGTVCIGGVEHDVAELVTTSETPGFYAAAIGGLDWGVIELDATGMYKLFFQFVPVDAAAPALPRQIVVAGLAGYGTSIVALSALWSSKGLGLGEAVFRGSAVATLALGAAALVRWVLAQDNESRASLAFSTLLHAALLFATFQLYEHGDPFAWAGPRELTASYIVSRIESTPTSSKPAAAVPVPAPTSAVSTTVKTVTTTMPVQRPWREPMARPPSPTPHPGPPGLDTRATATLDSLLGGPRGGVDALVGKIGEPAGAGGHEVSGPTTRGGSGKGPAGSFTPGVPGGLDTGPIRRGTICIGSACAGAAPIAVTPLGPSTDANGSALTATDIDNVIHAAAHRLTACYERELDHDPRLAGTVSIRFEIAADGSVKTAKVTRSSVTSEKVGDCVARAITLLRFPPRGGAVVSYPFVFAPKG